MEKRGLDRLMRALVVDGYNAIHKIPYLKKIMDKNLTQARAEITKLAKEYQRKRGGIDKIYVVFDGKDAYRDKTFDVPSSQVFSRTGKGDEEVVGAVGRLSRKYQVEVVTDDNFIRNNSRAYKATVLGISEFAAVVNKNWRKSIAKERGINKVTQERAIKINEELKKHWSI